MKLSKIQTYTLVRDVARDGNGDVARDGNGDVARDGAGQWRIAAFQNTRRKPLMEAVSYRFAPGLVPAAER
ncbi:hypothetical protein QMF80_33085 [Streptomyces sp. G-G2]|nr:hypothetical protein [Streptomyces sp. G-G2]